MPIIFPETPDPLLVNWNNISRIKDAWSELNLKILENDICSNLLRMQNIPEMTPWNRFIVTEEYQIQQIVHFFDFTVQLLQDLHRPKVNALHNQMMVQISNINTRIFQIETKKYSEIGESLSVSMLEQLGREIYNTEIELVWTKFYSDVANLMISHSKEPVLEFNNRTRHRRKSSQISTISIQPTTPPQYHLQQYNSQPQFDGISQHNIQSTSEISTATSPSRLSLNFDETSDMSFVLESADTSGKKTEGSDVSASTIMEVAQDSEEVLIHHSEPQEKFPSFSSSEDEEEEEEEEEEEALAEVEDDDDVFDYLNAFSELKSHSKVSKQVKSIQKTTHTLTKSYSTADLSPESKKLRHTSSMQLIQAVETTQRRKSISLLRSNTRNELIRSSSIKSNNVLSRTASNTKSDNCVIM